MNPDIVKYEIQQLEEQYSDYDLGKIFPELVKLYQEQKNKILFDFRNCLRCLLPCENNKVEKILEEKKLLNFEYTCLFASGFSSQVPIEYFLEEILRIYPRIKDFVIWNSDLSSTDFFKKLAQTKIKCEKFYFCYCNIGNSLAHHLSLLQAEHIQSIVIRSDPISNKGVKLLIEMNLTGLQILCLTNVNITADIFKVMKKLVSRKLQQYHFNFLPLSEQVLKQTLDLMRREQSTFRIYIYEICEDKVFVFLNIMAKVHLSQTSILNREINVFPDRLELYDPFTSPKVIRSLSQVLNYIPQ